LNVKKVAQTTAVHKSFNIDMRTAVGPQAAVARLRAGSGHTHPLVAVATRIGRLPDNDIVLDDVNVSRHHAVIIDTGTSFVITDLRSANGVELGSERIRGTATLADGDVIRICDYEFTFELTQTPRS
jgi:pSer/pThr/pTyr-binding forkhead associated (FHA) protein